MGSVLGFLGFTGEQGKEKVVNCKAFLQLRADRFTVSLSETCCAARRGNMEPIVNLEEKIGKMVGKNPQRTPAEFLERMAREFDSLDLKLPYPKGVYRFKTFEEADAWEMKHRIAAAVTRLRDHQR